MMRRRRSASAVTNGCPRLFAAIVEAPRGVTLTVFLRTAGNGDGTLLLINRPADDIDEAHALIRAIARERAIAEPPCIDVYTAEYEPSPDPLH